MKLPKEWVQMRQRNEENQGVGQGALHIKRFDGKTVLSLRQQEIVWVWWEMTGSIYELFFIHVVLRWNYEIQVTANGALVNIKQLTSEEERVLCRLCQFLWCVYSHHPQFWATNLKSLHFRGWWKYRTKTQNKKVLVFWFWEISSRKGTVKVIGKNEIFRGHIVINRG